MEAEIVALATSGATTLVSLMVTELWSEARGRFASLFGRRSEDVGEDLDQARAELLAADDPSAVAAGAETEWGNRLRRALAADPEAAARLRALLDELSPAAQAAPGPAHTTVTTTTTVNGEFRGVSIQAGSVGSVHTGQ
ncbi:hypothetical protein OG871_30995 [Kitasatospora sp. NBC_00374]|uniref:hypothetical protein n=1 Tax=Kitasatospora sp. NBC_00374 TaxID=2975964 RepID=UPI003250E2A3